MLAPWLGRFFCVVALGLAALGALSASPGDEAEVRAYLRDFADCWTHAAREEELAAYYAEDATHVDAGGELGSRRDALARALAGLGGGGSARFDVSRVSFLADRVALVDGTLAVRERSGRGEERSERFAFVLKKTGGGWKIAASRATPPETR